jgi:hypothetical protein
VQLHHHSSRALLPVHHQQHQHQRQHISHNSSSVACRTSLADVGPSFSNGGNSNNPLELLRVTRDVQVKGVGHKRACNAVRLTLLQPKHTAVF